MDQGLVGAASKACVSAATSGPSNVLSNFCTTGWRLVVDDGHFVIVKWSCATRSYIENVRCIDRRITSGQRRQRVMDLAFDGVANGGQGLRYARMRPSFSLGQLGLGSVAEVLLEHRVSGRKYLPRLGQGRAAVSWLEGETPSHGGGVANRPSEFAARFGRDDLATRFPRVALRFVATGQPGAYGRTGALVPPTRLADRAPLAHSSDVGDNVVNVARRASDEDGIGELEFSHDLDCKLPSGGSFTPVRQSTTPAIAGGAGLGDSSFRPTHYE
jgi:hypothetical protein